MQTVPIPSPHPYSKVYIIEKLINSLPLSLSDLSLISLSQSSKCFNMQASFWLHGWLGQINPPFPNVPCTGHCGTVNVNKHCSMHIYNFVYVCSGLNWLNWSYRTAMACVNLLHSLHAHSFIVINKNMNVACVYATYTCDIIIIIMHFSSWQQSSFWWSL